ncbi:unnamed protein product [Caenorhabditis angaria]|uniref:J domain-containing protein n=1 Tax=Caenorhabditis angaria TaxID=860376 RepID=A0A9P1I5L2_9PELO|nr:unnamed protein product [Caenorhabditis angaria]
MSVFDSFYQDLKNTENADAVLTSEQQIERLLKPGSTYLNLNPFEVLQIDPETDIEVAKKKYKKLSLLVHPDKNPDDRERADKAFDIIKKALKQIEDPVEVNRCKDCYTEARARLNIVMAEKKRKLRKEGKEDIIEEDDPAGFRKALRRATELLTQAAEKRKLAEEFAKNYEESRDERSGSWRNFQAKKAKKEEKGKTLRGAAFKPPKVKIQK